MNLVLSNLTSLFREDVDEKEMEFSENEKVLNISRYFENQGHEKGAAMKSRKKKSVGLAN